MGEIVTKVGSDVAGYIIKSVIARRPHFDVFEVVDNKGKLLYMKLFHNKDEGEDKMRGREPMVNRFTWEGQICFIYDRKDLAFDYFSLDFEGAGTERNKSCGNKIVRTPMPFDPLSDCNSDENDSFSDDSDDNENDYEDNENYDRSGDEDSSPLVFDGCTFEINKCNSSDTKVAIPSILIRDNNSVTLERSWRNCHIEIESPKSKCKKVKYFPRTPTPCKVDDCLDGQELGREQEPSNCNFELKMVASSMLKRREAKSLAI